MRNEPAAMETSKRIAPVSRVKATNLYFETVLDQVVYNLVTSDVHSIANIDG